MSEQTIRTLLGIPPGGEDEVYEALLLGARLIRKHAGKTVGAARRNEVIAGTLDHLRQRIQATLSATTPEGNPDE